MRTIWKQYKNGRIWGDSGNKQVGDREEAAAEASGKRKDGADDCCGWKKIYGCKWLIDAILHLFVAEGVKNIRAICHFIRIFAPDFVV